MVDLISKLSKQDRQTLINYISIYGVPEEEFVGLDEWLQQWSHSNQRLYSLLGNKLIHTFPFEYNKPKIELINELSTLVENSRFVSEFKNYMSILRSNFASYDEGTINSIESLIFLNTLIKDEVDFNIKLRKPGVRKMLQIQKGMKPIRAIQKVIEFFKDDFVCDFKLFEEFRIKHSLILNDKVVKGNISISIHPMDFITMSDNNSRWTSCMNWKDKGCYRVGTVEMMNSNNVLCCYLTSNEIFDFNLSAVEDPPASMFNCDYPRNITDNTYHYWNNKRWRTLCYFTNDIIMSGKSYPYTNDELSLSLIKEIKMLAEKNLKHKYSFGPELYKDMIHIDSMNKMDRNKNWLAWNESTKHNILWDTKGMYNDMLNDSNTQYWCYRNKVKKIKIYSVSGKAKCLCCNKDALIPNEYNDEYDYNERYQNTNMILCQDCFEYHYCDYCENPDPFVKHYQIKKYYERFGEYRYTNICKKCFKEKIKLCPCCNKPMIIKVDADEIFYQPPGLKGYYPMTIHKILNYENYNLNEFSQPVFICEECINKNKNLFEQRTYPRNRYCWEDPNQGYYEEKIFLKENLSEETTEKFLYQNLISAEPSDITIDVDMCLKGASYLKEDKKFA